MRVASWTKYPSLPDNTEVLLAGAHGQGPLELPGSLRGEQGRGEGHLAQKVI